MTNMTKNPAPTPAWLANHRAAMSCPRAGFESVITRMLRVWHDYATAVRLEYDATIGDDSVLGEHWADMGRAIRGLLNGEHGRLDAGTIDADICSTLRAQGFEP